MTVLNRIQNTFEKLANAYQLRLSFWGNDLEDFLYFHQDFFEFADTFLTYYESDVQPANIFLVVGAMNPLQIKKLKERYESCLDDNKYIIHILSSNHVSLLESSFMQRTKLEDELPVDLVYAKTPIDLSDFVPKVLSLVGKKNG